MGHSKLGNQPSPPDPPPSAPPQQAPPETWIMGAPSAPPAITGNGQADTYVSVEHVQSPFASSTGGGPANACASHPVINTSSDPVPNQGNAISNPYVNISSVPSKSPKETIINVLGRVREEVGGHDQKGWGCSCEISGTTEVFAEGGHGMVFQQKFVVSPGEKLRKAYASYLSTSAGPVIGTLYLSTARIAFCSDNPLRRNISNGQQEWTYYKIYLKLI